MSKDEKENRSQAKNPALSTSSSRAASRARLTTVTSTNNG